MRSSLAGKGFLGASAVLALVSFAGGAMYLLGQLTVDVGGTAMRIGVGSVLILGGLGLAAGLWRSRNSERSRSGLIAAGAVPAAICFWWTGVVPVVALPVAYFGIRRSREQARIRRERS